MQRYRVMKYFRDPRTWVVIDCGGSREFAAITALQGIPNAPEPDPTYIFDTESEAERAAAWMNGRGGL